MRFLFSVCVLFFSLPLFGLIEVGQEVPNFCWTDQNQKNVCLNDSRNTIRVLIYNAGWCPDCNVEFAALVPKVKTYAGMPVTFISLSSAGFKHGSPPDTAFLKAWKEKHQIPFAVVASPKDSGKSFYDPPLYIPNFVIIDKTGVLAYKKIDATIDMMFTEIERLL